MGELVSASLPVKSPRIGLATDAAATVTNTARFSSRQLLWAVLAFAFVARLLTIGLYPLTDTTEARYAEIARKMLETGQWIVPQIDYGIPFWGKPPLSFWLTAMSYRLMGVNEFAARIPSLLLVMTVCGLVHVLASRRRDIEHGLRASVVMATTLMMMVSAGGVMTDPTMLAGTTLSMVAFWLALTAASRVWGYLFFVGLAIGLLAKGPVATVLTLLPIGVWTLLAGRARDVWQRLPWLTGTLLTAVLVIPWYWAAESQSPGFLRYFLIGEHWQRYTISGWTGDLYGSGHASTPGMIWLYALVGTLPWSPWLLWRLARHKAARASLPLRSGDGWPLYLLCWMLAPVVFFTAARNILPTYVLPGLAGFGLLVAEAWEQRGFHAQPDQVLRLGLVTPILAILLLVAWPYAWGYKSQKEIVSIYRDARQTDNPLVYFKGRPYSAEFYSAGSARAIDDDAQLRQLLARTTPTYVAMRRDVLEQLPGDLRARLDNIPATRKGEYVLLRMRPAVL